jgi:hypothetical protein
MIRAGSHRQCYIWAQSFGMLPIPYVDVGHGWSKIARDLLDETGAPGVISEWQLILSASFEDSKQAEIESLEDLGCMGCESNDSYTSLREKINHDRSEVKWTIIHQ